MRRWPILEWDALGEGIRLNEPATAVGSQLFRILDGAGYSPEEIRTIAQTLCAYAD